MAAGDFIADVEAAWADFRIEVDEFRDLGGATVLILGQLLRARGKGSGIPVEAATGWVAVVRDGKVHRFASFTSREAALAAVGLPE